MNKIILLIHDSISVSKEIKKNNIDCLFLDYNIDELELWDKIGGPIMVKDVLFIGKLNCTTTKFIDMLPHKYYCTGDSLTQNTINAIRSSSNEKRERDIGMIEGILYALLNLNKRFDVFNK